MIGERVAVTEVRSEGLVSIVVPAYNEEENLVPLFERVCRVMDRLGTCFELIVVENGSTDGSLETLKALHSSDDRLHYVSLSRNFGHQGGLIAGLDHCKGDVVLTMDADLQHPPEVIPEMLALWRQGNEVVYTIKRRQGEQPVIRRAVNASFYRVASYLSGIELSGGQSDFRLMDRKAIDALRGMPENNKFLRGLARWIGFRQAGIEYDVPPRVAGESKFRFTHLFRFALDGILAFSILPLRVFLFAGLAISILSFGYGFHIMLLGVHAYMTGHFGRLPPGWVTASSAIFFLGGIQLIGIGLLGEYLGRVYDEVKNRPTYIVTEHSLQR